MQVRKLVWPALLVAAGFASPASAHAANLCVAPASDPACAASYPTLAGAVAAAPPNATVELAAGTYAGGLTIAKPLNITGIGAGAVTGQTDPASQTVIQGSLTMNAGGSLAAVRVLGSTAAGASAGPPPAVQLGYAPDSASQRPSATDTLLNVVAIGATAQLGAFSVTAGAIDVISTSALTVDITGGGYAGIYVAGQGVAVTLHKTLASGPASCAVQSAGGATVEIDDSTAQGGACGSGLTILRSELFGRYGLQETDTATTNAVTVRDSLLVGTAAGAQIGEDPSLGGPPPAGKASLTAVGSTFVAVGATTAPEGAVLVRSAGASVTLRNTIVRLTASAAASPSRADLVALGHGDAVTAADSSYTTVVANAGAKVTAAGTHGNVKGDPRLKSPAAGDYSLAPGSPLIDRGDPAFIIAGERDLHGDKRSVDGLLDCIALPDIGALEFMPRGRCTALASKLVLSRQTVTPTKPAVAAFTLAHDATVTIQVEQVRPHGPARPGPKVRLSMRAGRRRVTLTGRVGATRLAPGSYELILTAVRGSGPQSRPLTARFRVLPSG